MFLHNCGVVRILFTNNKYALLHPGLVSMHMQPVPPNAPTANIAQHKPNVCICMEWYLAKAEAKSFHVCNWVIINTFLDVIDPIYKFFLKPDFFDHDITFLQLYAKFVVKYGKITPIQSKANHDKMDAKWDCYMDLIDVIIKHTLMLLFGKNCMIPNIDHDKIDTDLHVINNIYTFSRNTMYGCIYQAINKNGIFLLPLGKMHTKSRPTSRSKLVWDRSHSTRER